MDQYTMALKKYTEEYEDWCLCKKKNKTFKKKVVECKDILTECKDRDIAVGGGERIYLLSLLIKRVKNKIY